MSALLPYLMLLAPDGTQQTLYLTKTRYTIGRLADNDIPLPDDRPVITRIEHCVLERIGKEWWLLDHSTNGTTLQRGEQQVDVRSYPNAKVQVSSGDRIQIHGWSLTFYDLSRTSPLEDLTTSPHLTIPCPLVYKLGQATLYRIAGNDRQEIPIRPQLRKMFGYMAHKNLSHRGEPILCTYQELIDHIWGADDFGADRHHQDLNGLAKELRKILAEHLPTNQSPETVLKTIKGAGYLLQIPIES